MSKKWLLIKCGDDGRFSINIEKNNILGDFDNRFDADRIANELRIESGNSDKYKVIGHDYSVKY